jgi:hypothetical protein
VADTNTDPNADEEGKDSRNELLAAIVLGIAATVTALAAWQGGVAGGDASNARLDAAKHLADANFFYSQANQTSAADQALFVPYAAALTEDNTALADYLTTLMRPELQAAVDWWNATDDAVTPFEELEGNPYTLEDLEAANAEQEASEGLNEEAEDLDAKADKFDLSTVILALTLFFAGVATLLNKQSVQMGLLAISAVTMLIGIAFFIQGYAA